MIKRIVAVLFTVFLLMPVAARAEFPTTGILDDFNRANEGPPLSSSWVISYEGLKVVSNQCAPNATSENWYEDKYNTSWGSDVEAYFTIATLDVNTEDVYTYIKNDGSTAYSIHYNGTAIWLGYLVSGDETLLNATNYTLQSGYKLGISYVDGVLTGWVNNTTSWTSVVTASNSSSLNTSGFTYLGMHSINGSMRYDDFGGGNYTAPIVSEPPSGQIIFID